MTIPACLAELVAAIALDPPSCSWLAESHPLTRPADQDQAAMARGLAERLYADFYVTGGVAPHLPPLPRPWWSTASSPDLSSVNAGTGSRQIGWTIVGHEGSSLVIEKGGLRLRADAARVLESAGGIEVLMPAESVGLPAGFYTAYGDAGNCEPTDGAVDRHYWNIAGPGRPTLLAQLTAALNQRSIAFRFKVLTDAEAERCDAGVLYTATAVRGDVAVAVAEVSRSVRPHLRARVPALAKSLAPGVGFAEDPIGDESFGTHRCALIADALVTAHARGVVTDRGRLGAIAERFAREGVSLDHPHLNPGSDPARDSPPFA